MRIPSLIGLSHDSWPRDSANINRSLAISFSQPRNPYAMIKGVAFIYQSERIGLPGPSNGSTGFWPA
jgi:hypothetical protein